MLLLTSIEFLTYVTSSLTYEDAPWQRNFYVSVQYYTFFLGYGTVLHLFFLVKIQYYTWCNKNNIDRMTLHAIGIIYTWSNKFLVYYSKNTLEFLP